MRKFLVVAPLFASIACGGSDDPSASSTGGAAGASGATGKSGAAGSSGKAAGGASGKAGNGGAAGASGKAGSSGIAGASGKAGSSGIAGASGKAGSGGVAGASGGAGSAGKAAGGGGGSGGSVTGGSGGSGGSVSAGSGGSAGTGGGPTLPPAPCAGLPLVDTTTPTTVVGDGTPASCTAAKLEAAVAVGGVVTFSCGGAATISLDAPLAVTKDVTVDGGHQITLSGQKKSRVFVIDTKNFEATSPTLTVQRLTLRDGKSTGTATPLGIDTDGGGGAIYHLGGHVTAIDSTFVDNEGPVEGPDVGGGAIYGVGVGKTHVSGCTFTNNKAANGGAIGVLGGDLTIVNSTFTGNAATGFGANSVVGGMQVGRGGNGGTIVMDGKGKTLDICGVTVSGGRARAFGGAVFRTGYASETTRIDRSTFDGNEVADNGEGEPSGAGGLYLQGTKVTIDATTISGNKARFVGGLWILDHGAGANAEANLTNVTIFGNATWKQADFTKRGIVGGLLVAGNTTGTLLNVTIAANEAQFAGGIGGASLLTIKNSVINNVAENVYAPYNCTGTAFAMPPGKGDHTLQWPAGLKDDMDCIAGVTRVDPLLGPLADNGGGTKTALPLAGSPALAGGAGCAPFDQRGKPRKAACTLGAVEVE